MHSARVIIHAVFRITISPPFKQFLLPWLGSEIVESLVHCIISKFSFNFGKIHLDNNTLTLGKFKML